jgi:hypothetical protein
MTKKADPRVDKRRVTMTNFGVGGVDSNGAPVVTKIEKVDYVRPDFLDAYLAAAQGQWQNVTVSDEPDAGPGGYDGPTHVPAELDHPLAGQTFPATDGKES